jgi:hypothetical protein
LKEVYLENNKIKKSNTNFFDYLLIGYLSLFFIIFIGYLAYSVYQSFYYRSSSINNLFYAFVFVSILIGFSNLDELFFEKIYYKFFDDFDIDNKKFIESLQAEDLVKNVEEIRKEAEYEIIREVSLEKYGGK